MSGADKGAFRLGSGEGRRIWAFGDLMIVKLTREQSSGRAFVMEQHVPRHQGVPGRHVHAVDDQSWFVIPGRGRWFIGDQVIEAGPGHFVHGPHGVQHAFCADPEDPELARRHGTTALGPEPRWTPLPVPAS